MKLIAPVLITDAVLTASSLTENDTDDAPLWGAGAKTVEQRVRRPTTHRVYECLVAHTAADVAGDYPENNLTGPTPKWLTVKPTNKHAAFDNVMSTQSVAPESMSWTLSLVNIADSVTMYEVEALTVRVKQTVGGVVKYDKTVNTRNRNVRTFRDFFFKPVTFRRDVSFTDLPPYRNSTVEITVSKPGSVAKVGDIQVGRFDSLGDMLWAPSVRAVDYSIVTADKFGNTLFTPRRVVNVVECDIFVENGNFDEVVRLLKLGKSSPRSWLGDPRFGALNNFAYVQDFRVVLSSPAGSNLNIQLQGLT